MSADERAAWLRNKEAIHATLNAAGVPEFDGEERRISARLRWLLRKLSLADDVVNYARTSYDVTEWPAEEGNLYKAIKEYDAAR